MPMMLGMVRELCMGSLYRPLKGIPGYLPVELGRWHHHRPAIPFGETEVSPAPRERFRHTPFMSPTQSG